MKIFLFSLFLYSLLFTPSSLLLHAYPPGWSDDLLLTPENMKERNIPDVDVDCYSNIWVVWDSATWANGTGEVLYSKRDSLGACLIPETDVSNNVTYSLLPRIAVDASNNVHIIWRDESPQGFGIHHAKLANDGSVLVPSHLAVGGAGDLYLAQMTINKYKEINIVWDEAPSGYNQMNYTKLDSMGDTLIGRIRVSPVGVYAFWPGIEVDSFANCHLGYRLAYTSIDSLAYTKIDKNGNILISNKILDAGTFPSIVVDRSQNIHMVYPHNPTGYAWYIRYLKLDQNGNIIAGPITLSLQPGLGTPHIALDSLQYLHVVWEAESSGVWPIIYTKLDTMGNYVIPPMQIVYPPYTPGGGHPRIAVDKSNRLHLVWVDGRLDPGETCDIFYKRGENETTVQEINKLHNVIQNALRAYPNPFTDETRITSSNDVGGHSSILPSELKIFDISGRQVKSFDIQKFAGSIIWQGTDDHNIKLPNGVYFIRFAWKTGQQTMPITKIN